MRKNMIPLFALTLLLAAAQAIAEPQKQFDAAARAKVIAPFIDPLTFAVAHVDLTRIEADPLIDKLEEILPSMPKEPELRKPLKEHLAAFRQAGGKDLYVVLSLADVNAPGPFAIVPIPEGADQKALASLFTASPNVVIERLGNVLFVGDKRPSDQGKCPALERLKSLKAEPRPELVKAFESAGDTAAQVLLLPTSDSRRVIEEMMPTLPSEIGNGPSRILTRGILWAVASADPPPKMSLKVLIQSQDAQAAQALHDKLVSVYKLVAQIDQVQWFLPDFAQIAKVLTPTVQGDQLVLTLDEQNQGVSALFQAVMPALAQARSKAMQAQSINNLKQIGLALHAYHDLHKSFPSAASYDKQGKPLLSWRVHLLPLLGEKDLYKQFHLDEPWDSEHNRKLIEKMPAVYRSAASQLAQQGQTSYLAIAGKETVFPGQEAVRLQDIKDGTSNTIMVVEVGDDRALSWTKPDDLPFDPQSPDRGLGGPSKDGFAALFCDGHVQFVKLPMDRDRLRALITRAGGEAVTP